MVTPIPPSVDKERWATELKLVPRRMRDDAIQEAWVAHLEGRDPVKALIAFKVGELRAEDHGYIIPNSSGDMVVHDKDGKVVDIDNTTRMANRFG